MTFTILTDTEFETFVNSQEKTSFEQSLEMAKLRQARGYDVHLLGYKDDNGQVQVAALSYFQKVAGGKKLEIYYGPVYTTAQYLEAFLEELKAYSKTNRVLELGIFPAEPYQLYTSEGQPMSNPDQDLLDLYEKHQFKHQSFQTGYEGNQLFWHYVKDLKDLNKQSLQKSFTKNGKATVKKAGTFGIKIRSLKKEELHLFKEITSSTSERREYHDKSLEYYQQFYDSFGDKAEFMYATLNFQDYHDNLERDQSKLGKNIDKLKTELEINPNSTKKQNQLRELSSQFETFTTRKAEAREFIQKYGQQDVPLAASLFIYTPQEAVYLFSGSYTEFNRFYAPALLQEHVMNQAIQRGIPFYNFLGITGIFDGSDGVLRFKQNFNGYIVRKMGTFTYSPNPFKQKFIHTIKKILGRY